METAPILRFGPYELDVRAAELRKHGIRIRLQQQSFQILLMLLDQPGGVVLREDIRVRLWPNNTIVEFDHSINAAIKRLRNALGESAEAPRHIETLAKRGYRFMGEVEKVGPAIEILPAVPLPASPNTEDGERSGAVVSHYRILDKLGEGGMGVVYRAEDTRLGRQVAVKFLPAPASEIAPLVLRRFEREARAASALNHPNICTIYGLEDFDGQPGIVMELVNGETLSARLSKGRLPLEEALRIAVQVAGALVEAHRKGVVHRDLKPGNIMLTKTGVKVLDFGLAKMERAAAASDETATMAGVVLGTPHYMSPEQAQGQDADTRSDIFAFGVVLYEMLAAKRPFEGQNPASVMAAILERDPPPFGDSVSSPLDRVVRRCLAKSRDERWQSAWDLQSELEWILEAPAVERPVGTGTFPVRRIDWRWTVIAALAALSVVLGATVLRQKPAEIPLLRFNVFPPEGAPFGGQASPAVSPDGRRFLFVTTWKQKYQIWLRSLDLPDPAPLLGPDGAMLDTTPPFWSQDSRSIGFAGDGKIRRLDLDRPGGPGEAVTICAAADVVGASWSRDGVILFSTTTDGLLYRVPDTGGSPKQVTRLDESRHETNHGYPWFLPDGRHFLYEALSPPFPWAHRTIRVGSLDSAESKILLDADSQATFAHGRIFFVRDETLQAQPFNPGTLAITGEAAGVASQVTSTGGFSSFSAAEEGPLIYVAGADAPRNDLAWYDRSGNRISTLAEARLPVFPNQFPALSPDQSTVALADIGQKLSDLWLYDVARGRRTRFTFNAGGPVSPVWSPDGKSMAYASVRNGHFDIYRKPVDGGSAEELLYSDADDKYPTSWSPDGKCLLFDRISYKKPESVWVLSLTADRGSAKPSPLPESASGEMNGEFSPDGRWISYSSLESGAGQVYLVPFGPGGVSPGGKRQVSPSGGNGARWRKDGKEIFYRKGRSLVAAAVTNSGHGIDFGEERQMVGSVSILGYDVSADGQRFLLSLRARQATTQPLTVVQNWMAALKK